MSKQSDDTLIPDGKSMKAEQRTPGLSKAERWILVALEILFGLCALSVVAYQVTGRFDFGFGFVSYRFFNIALSVVIVGWIVRALVKRSSHVLIWAAIFSGFHLTEGLIIAFWFKVVIHSAILAVIGAYYFRNKTLSIKGGPPPGKPLRRTRHRAVSRAVLAVVLVVGLSSWVHWGTRWTVPSADGGRGGCQLAAHWNGANIPGGKFEHPIGIAVAPDGDVYVTDARERVVHLNPQGGFLGEWGREGHGTGDFSNPMGVAVAPDGSVLVSDYDLDRVQKFTADGKFLLSFGKSGSGPGEFDAPAGIAVDADGFVYVADFYNHRIQKFSADGKFQKVIGHPGRLGAGALHYPTGVAITPQGQLLVADAYNYELQWFTAAGQPLGRLGYHLFWLWPRPASSTAGFDVPSGVAMSRDGRIYVADSGNHRVVTLSPERRFLSAWKMPDAGSKIYSPEQVAVAPDGATVYATDLAANRIVVLKVVDQAGSSGTKF